MALKSEFKSTMIFAVCGVTAIIIAASLSSKPGALIGSMIAFAVVLTVVGFIFGKSISSNIFFIKTHIASMAEGDMDLSKRLPQTSNDELDEISRALNRFIEKIEDVVWRVKSTSLTLDSAIQEISSGSQELSQSSQQQASAIEEVAATIEQMTSSIKQTASNADTGREKARAMVSVANNTSVISQDLIRRMDEMSEASKKIGDIIVTVNEVAFQTNLLALNAAVEAARAGEHGKGFAVVAEEVRALAQRSADASRQIKALIEDTVEKIKAGDAIVKHSVTLMEEMLVQITGLSSGIEEIAASLSEQATGVDEVNNAISQIDRTTQHNAAMVEELAGTSKSLKVESKNLDGILEYFIVSAQEEEEA